ncbi:MAG: hypothetical protein CR988_07825 [Treponema sp.]|nr:MAG: hypothetical protein CR988_07825 [Treponema sp.]
MTEIELWEKYKKCKGLYTQIKLKDGTVKKGYPVIFTKAIDNTPEVSEIDIEDENGNLSAWYLEEIDSIEILKTN